MNGANTLCTTYNALYIKLSKSKKRKRYWAEKIKTHKETCSVCQTREKIIG